MKDFYKRIQLSLSTLIVPENMYELCALMNYVFIYKISKQHYIRLSFYVELHKYIMPIWFCQ